jgi:SAM-dependent methyltransferase
MVWDKDSAARARKLWEAKASEWHKHSGPDGDVNRRHQSDPVLRELLGEVDGLDVLDAGCGPGYLSVQMARRGARVLGVDWSEPAIAIARTKVEKGLALEFRVDDCMTLATVNDRSVDAVASNYVLMDLPGLDDASAAMARVLRPGGRAVVVVNHPCFCPPDGHDHLEDGSVTHHWRHSYFEEWEFTESWGIFSTTFQGYHRPLSRYWTAFREAGFAVTDFREPVVGRDRPPEVDPAKYARMRLTPWSVAFALRLEAQSP